MITYEEFLNKSNIISEDLFDDIVSTLPNIDIEDVDFSDVYEFDSQDEISSVIISAILAKWDWVTCSDVNFEKRTFYLDDVQSIKDLEEIKETFVNWNITNYEEALEWCKENEKNERENEEREKIIMHLRHNATIEQLRKFEKEV